MTFQLYAGDQRTVLAEVPLDSKQNQQVRIGEQAFVNLISIDFQDALPINTLLAYNFTWTIDEQQHSLVECLPEILYSGQKYPNFAIKSDIKQMLHGSCRKPHFDSGDGLVQVDHIIADSISDATLRPAMLMMSGDQIYADDVNWVLLFEAQKG